MNKRFDEEIRFSAGGTIESSRVTLYHVEMEISQLQVSFVGLFPWISMGLWVSFIGDFFMDMGLFSWIWVSFHESGSLFMDLGLFCWHNQEEICFLSSNTIESLRVTLYHVEMEKSQLQVSCVGLFA